MDLSSAISLVTGHPPQPIPTEAVGLFAGSEPHPKITTREAWLAQLARRHPEARISRRLDFIEI